MAAGPEEQDSESAECGQKFPCFEIRERPLRIQPGHHEDGCMPFDANGNGHGRENDQGVEKRSQLSQGSDLTREFNLRLSRVFRSGGPSGSVLRTRALHMNSRDRP